MIDILIGGAAVFGFWRICHYTRRRRLRLSWWQWTLSAAGLIYSVFVLELIYGFLSEGASRGALVMGLIFGFPALIWGVLLARFVFTKRKTDEYEIQKEAGRNV